MLNLNKILIVALLTSISLQSTYSMEEFSEPAIKKSKIEFDFEDIEKSNVSSLKDLSLLEVLYATDSSHLLPVDLLVQLIDLANEETDWNLPNIVQYTEEEIKVFKEIAEYANDEISAAVYACEYQEILNKILINSILNNHTAIASFVIRKGANVNVKDEYGYSALTLAALRNNKSIVNLLLDSGCCIDTTTKTNRTALMYAADCGLADIVNLLIFKKANLELKDKYGNTAADFALMAADKETILSFFPDEKIALSLTLNKKVDFLSNKHSKDLDTKMILVLLNTMSQFLLNNGQQETFNSFSAPTIIFNNSLRGGTTLTEAAKKGHENLVRTLLNQGINCNAHNFAGELPLIAASGKGHFKIVKTLFKGVSGNRADLNLANLKKETALMVATEKEHFKVVKYLTDQGANDNNTALALAAEIGNEKIFNEIADLSEWADTCRMIKGSDRFYF